jgi:Fe-S-cluster containining protein
VTPKDIQQMAKHLSLTLKEFRARFTKKLTHGVVLIFVKGHCVFFEEKTGCKVHAAKPRQCSTWPYWPDNIKDGRFTPAVLKICKGCSHG